MVHGDRGKAESRTRHGCGIHVVGRRVCYSRAGGRFAGRRGAGVRSSAAFGHRVERPGAAATGQYLDVRGEVSGSSGKSTTAAQAQAGNARAFVAAEKARGRSDGSGGAVFVFSNPAGNI